jgi:hypothetical protein
MGKLRSAHQAFLRLSYDLVDLNRGNETEVEFSDYVHFFHALDAMEAVVDCAAEEIPGLSREDRANLRDKYEVGQSRISCPSSAEHVGRNCWTTQRRRLSRSWRRKSDGLM